MSLSSTNKNAFSDIKSLIFAVTGYDPKKVGKPEENPQLHAQAAEITKGACDEEYAKKIGMDPGLLVGREVRLTTHLKNTKPTKERPDGGVFTVHSWAPIG